MPTRVSDMTGEELREMIGELIEQKLVELFGDPDDGLALRKTLHDRLLRQQEAVVRGERGESLDDVAQRLGLA